SLGIATPGHERPGTPGFTLIACQQLQAQAMAGQAVEYRMPVVLGPEFVVAAGRRHDHGIGFDPRTGGKAIQAEIRFALVFITEYRGRELALPDHSGLPELNL